MEKQNRFVVIYTIFVGLSMVGLWSMLLITGQVPELSTTPFTAITHISAELTTGVLLISTSVGLLCKKKWANRMLPFSLGMLLYAVIQAIGYYIDNLSIFFVLFFSVLIILTTLSIFRRIVT